MKIGVVLVGLVSFFQQVDLSTARANFEKAEKSKTNTAVLFNLLKDYHQSDAILQAYKGASSVLQARYVTDQKTKKKLVVEGIRVLEGAIKDNSINIEMRLIRLIIQENTPKVLKYKMNMDADKQMILANFASQSREVKGMIKRYATTRSTFFTVAELGKLSN